MEVRVGPWSMGMWGNRYHRFLYLAIGVISATAHAVPSPNLDELEVRIWTADDKEMSPLENQIVRFAQIEPKSARAHQLLAHVLVRNFISDPGNLYTLRQASDLAQQAVDLAPLSDYGYVAMAEILDLMGDSDRGLKILVDAEASGVDKSWRYYFMKARLSTDQLPSKAVLKLYHKALSRSGSEPRIVVPYVIAMLQAEHSGEALIEKLTTWHREFSAPLFELTTAITYAELGEHKKAHEIYTNIIKNNPKNKEAKVNDAILLYRELKDIPKAVQLFQNVLSEHATELSDSIAALIRAHLAASYTASQQWDKAEQEFIRAVAADHRNLSILDFMSRAYKQAQAHQRLVAVLKRLNETIPGTSVTHAILGEILSETLAKHEDAVRAYSNAITLEPGRSDYYNGMGLAYYRKKNYDKALRLFTTATEVDPNDATARYNHACVLSLLGRTDEALSILSEAIALDPGLTKNAASDGDFANIRGFMRFRELVSAPASFALPNQEIGH